MNGNRTITGIVPELPPINTSVNAPIDEQNTVRSINFLYNGIAKSITYFSKNKHRIVSTMQEIKRSKKYILSLL